LHCFRDDFFPQPGRRAQAAARQTDSILPLSGNAYGGAVCLAAPPISSCNLFHAASWRARQQFALSIRQSASGLKPHHSKEIQYDEYDRDDEQYVDNVAGLRETRTYAPTEKAEQPQHE